MKNTKCFIATTLIFFVLAITGWALYFFDHQPIAANEMGEVMTEKQLARYLKISHDQLLNLIEKSDEEKLLLTSANSHVYDTYKFLPYMNIEGEKRFMKSQIDKWMEYQTFNQ